MPQQIFITVPDFINKMNILANLTDAKLQAGSIDPFLVTDVARAIKNNKSLQSLDLSDNNINDAILEGIFDSITTHPSLQNLNLRDNQISAAKLELLEQRKPNLNITHDRPAMSPSQISAASLKTQAQQKMASLQ